MNIYLVRHGSAEEKTLSGKDSDRKLTEKGKDIIIKSTNYFKPFISEIDIIISSPYKRAIQTAEILKKELNLKSDIIQDKRLAPGSRTENIIEICNEIDFSNIVFVGHEPDFSLHTSNLISNSGSQINVKKGTILKISFNGKPRLSGGTLEFLIPPL